MSKGNPSTPPTSSVYNEITLKDGQKVEAILFNTVIEVLNSCLANKNYATLNEFLRCSKGQQYTEPLGCINEWFEENSNGILRKDVAAIIRNTVTINTILIKSGDSLTPEIVSANITSGLPPSPQDYWYESHINTLNTGEEEINQYVTKSLEILGDQSKQLAQLNNEEQ